MYCLVPEKPLRLVYGTFYLAIGETFYEFINNCFDLNHGLCQCDAERFYRSDKRILNGRVGRFLNIEHRTLKIE